MNEYDDILNRIVEEFYDTGRLILEARGKRLTNDELRNIALNYKTRGEWAEKDKNSYQQAIKRGKEIPGFYEDITSHMIVLNKHLTNDELRNIAKKYRTKIEWRKNDPRTYDQAYNRDKKFPGFWEDITSDMETRQQKKYLTNYELRNIAKKYRTKSEWNTNDRNSYVQAYNRDKKFPGFWEDITSDMEIINASKKHIYAYEFYDKENNPIAVYVGLTCDMTRRNKEHQTGYCTFGKEETQVFKFIKENPKLKYEIKLLEPNQYKGREAEQKEIEWEEKYQHNGWRTLNIAKPGSLGGLYKLTNDELRNIALNYETKSEWKKNDLSTYNMGLRRGKDFYEDITSHMKSSSLTNDELRNIAKKYRTKIEWMKNDRKSYVQAYNRDKKFPGFWEDITSDMGSDDILDRIVEEFYDTGKLKLSEDIEFDVDNEDFGEESEGEIEYNDEESLHMKIFSKYFIEGLSQPKVAEQLSIDKNKVRRLTKPVNIEQVKEWDDFNNLIKKVYGIDDKKLNLIKLIRFYFSSNLKCIKWNPNKKMYDYQKPFTLEELKNYVEKLDSSSVSTKSAYTNIRNEKPCYYPTRSHKLYDPQTYERINFILNLEGCDEECIDEYWRLIRQLIGYTKQRTTEETEELIGKITEFIKLGNVTMSSLKKEFNLPQTTLSRWIKTYGLTELYDENKSDETYERTFEKDCGDGKYFELTRGEGNSSKISNTSSYNKTLLDKVSNPILKEKDIVSYLYKDIVTTETVKYDIKTLVPVNLEGGFVLQPKDPVEVKDTPYENGYHLMEFYGAFKNYTKQEKEDFQEMSRFESVIKKLSEQLQKDLENESGKGWKIIKSINDVTVGIFFSDYNFLPKDSYDLSWSIKGQRDEARLTIRVNWNNGPVYRWVEGNCNLQQNEPTDRLDNIIENFFDTGKFVI